MPKFSLQMCSSALQHRSLNIPLRPTPMHLQRNRMTNIRDDVLSPTPKGPNKLLRKRFRTRPPEVYGSDDQTRTDRPEVDEHKLDRSVVTIAVGDIETLVRVETGSELTDVCFGCCIERDSWHRLFVTGRTHECYEDRSLACRVPERGQECSCEQGGEYRVTPDLDEMFFLGPLIEP